MNKLVEHVKSSLGDAEALKTKLTEEIFELRGMSGKKTRIFYNNICSMEDARYLEIGTWAGSTVCSAMYKNKMKCLCMDNWSWNKKPQKRQGQNTGPKDEFLKYFNKYKGENDADFLEGDCWDHDPSKLGKFNIYMYDGKHTTEATTRALTHYISCMDDEFIYMVDDWNMSHLTKKVKLGTMKGIEECGLEVLWSKGINTDHAKRKKTGGCKDGWWNGIGIFVLKKGNK